PAPRAYRGLKDSEDALQAGSRPQPERTPPEPGSVAARIPISDNDRDNPSQPPADTESATVIRAPVRYSADARAAFSAALGDDWQFLAWGLDSRTGLTGALELWDWIAEEGRF